MATRSRWWDVLRTGFIGTGQEDEDTSGFSVLFLNLPGDGDGDLGDR